MRTFFLRLSIFVILFAISFTAKSSQSFKLYVGQSTFVSCPKAPTGAIYQTAWGSRHAAVSVTKDGTYGAKIKVTSFFSGTAQVQCDYYWRWYVGNRQYTNHATTYYNVTCEKVNIRMNQNGPVTLNSGDGINLSVTLSPSITPSPTVIWNSSNTNIAEVNQNGYVWARQPGSAIISASSNAGPDKATITINVNSVNVEKASITSPLFLEVGQTRQMSVSVNPSNATVSSVSWHSNNNNIAAINGSGLLTAVKHGTTSIYCLVNGLIKSNEATVTISKLNLALSANIDDGLLEKGTAVTLTASDNKAKIFYTLDGSTPSQSSVRYYAPIVIDKDVTLKAVAYHEDYNTSKILTKTYKVTSLKIVSTYPNHEMGDIGNYASIAISYNSPIDKGANFNDIQLSHNGKDVKGEFLISNNMFYFVPDSKFEIGAYTLDIPQNSLTDRLNNEVCMKYELNFSVCGKGNPYPIDYGGAYGQYVIKSDNSFWSWGQYPYTNTSCTYKYTPTKLMEGVISAATGDCFIATIKEDSSLWCWGQNDYGQLGLGHTNYVSSPTKITDNVKCVAADSHMLILKNDGTVWSCGYNYCGQLGNGEKGTTTNPALYKVPIEDIDTVATAFQISAAIKKDGSLWTWGRGEYIGTGSTSDKTTPVKIMTDVKSVSLCGMISFAIKKDNTLWMWGNTETPKKIMDNVIFVNNGNNRAHIIKTDGKLYSWGQNDYGQLGDGTKKSTGWLNSYGKALCILDSVQKVNVSHLQATGAMKSDGSIWTWGTNTYYSLGFGDKDLEQLTPKLLIEGQSKDLIHIERVSFLYDEIESYVEERIALPLILFPSNAYYSNISYSTDNPSIATVTNKGIVTTKSSGTTMIRAIVTAMNGNEHGTCYKLNISEHFNGIESIYNKNDISIQGYYDIHGRKQSKLQRGLNIIRYSDGSVQKILVK